MNQQSHPDLFLDRVDSIDPIIAAVAATSTRLAPGFVHHDPGPNAAPGPVRRQRSADTGKQTASPAAVTLQDVIDRLAGCEELSARRRRDLISALRTLARLLVERREPQPAARPWAFLRNCRAYR